MSPTLTVETSDLAAAAHALSDGVGTHLWAAVGTALSAARSCTGMAGDDPAGLSWAAAYEPAATAAAQAAEDVINAAFRLSLLLATTADNYARADAAATIGERHAVDTVIANLPGPTEITLDTRFRGVGGGPPDAPWGWSHVEHLVRLVWPNGHQDRLRRAAGAWHDSAGALEGRAGDVELVLIEPLEDGLPEWRDIRTACRSLAGHLRTVARAHRSLGHACADLAHQLDVAHSKVEHEIQVFLGQSAAIQLVGDALSAVTVGVAEVPTQAVEAGRAAKAVARIVEIITAAAADVGEIVSSLPLVEEVSSRVSAALGELLSVRVVSAEVAGVPGLRVLSLARDGRTAAAAAKAPGEVGAIARLADDADLPPELRAALDSPRSGEWNEPDLLRVHFARHGSDFGCTTEAEYESRARQFFRRATTDHLEVKIDTMTGDIRIYDPRTNTFGSYTADGTVRTFYKPTSPTYWLRQGGEAVTW